MEFHAPVLHPGVTPFPGVFTILRIFFFSLAKILKNGYFIV
jgi:hypothetical protein